MFSLIIQAVQHNPVINPVMGNAFRYNGRSSLQRLNGIGALPVAVDVSDVCTVCAVYAYRFFGGFVVRPGHGQRKRYLAGTAFVRVTVVILIIAGDFAVHENRKLFAVLHLKPGLQMGVLRLNARIGVDLDVDRDRFSRRFSGTRIVRRVRIVIVIVSQMAARPAFSCRRVGKVLRIVFQILKTRGSAFKIPFSRSVLQIVRAAVKHADHAGVVVTAIETVSNNPLAVVQFGTDAPFRDQRIDHFGEKRVIPVVFGQPIDRHRHWIVIRAAQGQ